MNILGVQITNKNLIGKVVIRNNTGERLLSVGVAHKYSNDFKNQLDWAGPVEIGAVTSEKDVNYRIGATTTGVDWWLVTWVTESNKRYITDPNNFRSFVDVAERVADWAGGALIGVAVKAALFPEPTVSKIGAAACAATGVILKGVTNSETTKGFKQHLLRGSDCESPTEIILTKDEVKFVSNSGTSSTGVAGS